MEAQVKIYTLAHPVTGEIKYIGKTKNDLNTRVRLHLSINEIKENARVKWIKKLKAQGLNLYIRGLELLFGYL